MNLKKAALVGALMAGACMSAQADEYGCQVLLCMSNPNGPMAVQQCVPPVQKFLEGQAKDPKDPFPQCPESKGQAGMTQGVNPYDDCPSGTKALASGLEVIQGMPKPPSATTTSANTIGRPTKPGEVVMDASNVGTLVIYTGIGDGQGMRQAQGKKICTGTQIGTLTMRYGTNEGIDSDVRYVSYPAYDRIVTMDPVKGSPVYYEVQIKGSPSRRVRF